MGEVWGDGVPHGVNARIARNVNGFRAFAFPKQMLFRHLRRREMPLGQQAYALAVEFLREGGIQIPGAQSRFHVAHRNLLIKRRHSAGIGGGGIPMHQNCVRLFFFDNFPHAQQHRGRDVIQILPRLHDL